MIGLRYEGEFLDVKPQASLSWELNNLFFSSSDKGKLPGSFSFPFDLPASPTNRALLGHPDRMDNADPFVSGGPVEVLYQGSVMFVGTLKVTSASEEAIKVYIVANPLSEVKKTPLNQLDLGGDRNIGNPAAMMAHAKATTEDPLDYDYIFFPVYNRDFITGEVTNGRARWQNWWDTGTDNFTVDHDHPNLMPFVRLDYLLDRIFLSPNYSFENQFQTDDELRRIVLYNNRSLWTDAGLPFAINLKNHVSKTEASAFVRKIMGAFCLGLFYNPWERRVRLTPLKNLFNTPPKHDWTEKLLHPVRVNGNADQPEVICWEAPGGDAAHAYFTKNGKPALVEASIYSDDLLGADPGLLYYVVDWHGYYWRTDIGISFEYSTLGCAPADSGSPAFEAECPPLHDIRLHETAPEIRTPGTVSYMQGGEEIVQEAEVPDRMTLYRGYYSIGGHLQPFASGLPYDREVNQIGDYSLRMDGPFGVYETWWKAWHTMMKTGKQVQARLLLSLSEIANFNFEDQVRIQNQNFFVKKMKITLTPRGLAPVDVELVSVI